MDGIETAGIPTFWKGGVEKLESEASYLLPELQKNRRSLSSELRETRAELHTPLLKELLELRDMGRAESRDQFMDGFPMLGALAEPACL